MASTKSDVGSLVGDFLDKATDRELELAQKVMHEWSAPKDMIHQMMDDLRRCLRKEMRAEVEYYPETGKQGISMVPIKTFVVCPDCMSQMNHALWIDAGEACFEGPRCAACFNRTRSGFAHDNGMTFGDARIYSLEVDAKLFEALAVFMVQLPDKVEKRVPKGPNGLPLDETSDVDEMPF